MLQTNETLADKRLTINLEFKSLAYKVKTVLEVLGTVREYDTIYVLKDVDLVFRKDDKHTHVYFRGERAFSAWSRCGRTLAYSDTGLWKAYLDVVFIMAVKKLRKGL